MWSAGHDEAVFEQPERFDPDRRNSNLHLAFGPGPHYCLGAGLARVETSVAIERRRERIPSLQLAHRAGLKLRNSFTIPSVEEGLLVTWDGRV
jgi:cytochrome P450